MSKEALFSNLDTDAIYKEASDIKSEALKKASVIIKAAAIQIKESNEKIAELQSAINNLTKDKMEEYTEREARDIANTMFNKGLIKKSDIENKISELKGIDKSSLAVIKKTISEIPEKTAEEGFSSLTFLCSDNNIEERETLLSAVSDFFK